MILGFHASLANGQSVDIASDKSWRIVRAMTAIGKLAGTRPTTGRLLPSWARWV